MYKKHGITFQITTVVILSFTLVFLSFSMLTTKLYSQAISSIMQDSSQHSTDQLNESFNTFYQQLIYILIQLSENSTVKQYLRETPEDNFTYYRMQRYVHDLLQSYRGFFPSSDVNIILYGSNGVTYTSYNETLHLEDTEIMNENFMKNSLENHRHLEICYSYSGLTQNTCNQNYIYLSLALYDPWHDSCYGSVLIVLSESCFYDLYSDLVTSNSRFSILTNEGMILSDSNRQQKEQIDQELLTIADAVSSSSSSMQEYQNQNYIFSSVYNRYFNFYLLQFTRQEAITSLVYSSVFSIMSLCFIIWLFVVLLIILCFHQITGPIHRLSLTMKNVSDRDLLSGLPKLTFSGCSEATLLAESFNEMFEHLERYTKNLIAEQEARHTAELNSLQYQINPHFMYNTLTSIKYLSISGQNEKVVSGINALIRLLREILGNIRETVPLQQEISVLTDYFHIQQLRYGDNIHLNLNIPDDCLSLLVPRFTLQPLVENSIFHGFSTNTPQGIISIYAFKIRDHSTKKELLSIEVIDNGKGIPSDILEQLLASDNLASSSQGTSHGRFTSIGIKNVEERIKMIFGPEYGLSIISTPNYGTQVNLSLPAISIEGDTKNESITEDTIDR